MRQFETTDAILPGMWASQARRYPHKPAIICGSRQVTWNALNATMNRLANGLIRSGLHKGDRVAVLASSSIEACEAMFGTVKSGAVMVPVSGMLTAAQVLTLLNDCQPSFIIVSSDLRHLVHPNMAAIEGLQPGRAIGIDFDGDGWTSLHAFCATAPDGEPDVVLHSDDVFSIMYSSGTTGLPKGAVHTHGARYYFSVSNASEMGFTAGARALLTTALYTAGTWTVLMPTLLVGGTLHIQAGFRLEEFLRTLVDERITHTFLVPSQIQLILAGYDLKSFDLSHLKVMLSAGSPLRPDIKARLIDAIGAKFFELYGFTEGTSTLLHPEDQATKALSVGRPLIGQELRIIDEGGNVCGSDEPGEIVGRGPGLLRSYYGRPRETHDAIWLDADGRSFVRSGDIGRIDADGFLYVLDRKKDMIISGGLNIYPADLEAVVGTHPEVLEVSVIGVEHEKWGETPLALTVLRDDATITALALLEWANARLAKHQRLAQVVVRQSLPRNALGKVLKRELRKEHAAVPSAG